MSRFIESIRIANGLIENLSLHQERVNRTLLDYSAGTRIHLEEYIKTHALSDQMVYKCRVIYDLNEIQEVQYIPYQKRVVGSLAIARDNSIEYHHKYANRDHINRLFSNSGADDIIIVKNGCVTDASYANLVFCDGVSWYTSNTPLLKGVRREQLIRDGIIKEAAIREEDICDFSTVRLINAMIPWEEAVEVPVSRIVFPAP
ncbi:aminotransferase class IV [Lentiprolixibacter aurantiacus]|uniref:Aminotransferase class IV n=1 Tax=Lentiprolixibacter aurantiacus TaxID=2993939 RepID=A0AAE3SQU8_9FLAO|nr:aminotransferase class IV [Lentiprolixibacter aurantiacus]MCX2720782.1 aminotransferase class IV [Lentiprolixibacter aurantiacus]